MVLGLIGLLSLIADTALGQPAGALPFVTDNRGSPGDIYRMAPDAGTRDPACMNPDGHVSSIAFGDFDVFFVNGNANHIYRSSRCRSTIIYTHST